MHSGSIVTQATAKARRAVLIALAGAAAVVTSLVIVGVIYAQQVRDANRSLVEAHRWADRILLSDERLTMSANMAAATGEERWIDRYDANIPVIDEAIGKALKLAPPVVAERFDTETRIANDKLVAMERAAFETVRDGSIDAARNILDGESYAVQKRVLSEGSSRFLEGVIDAVQRNLAAVERQAALAVGTVLLLSAVGGLMLWRALSANLEKSESAFLDAELKIHSLARHDPLTGLTNRRVLAEDLERALGLADRSQAGFAVVLIDLDRFKPVNDIHGHSAGDVVLCQIATRLKSVLQKQDTLSRIGGDEFAIVCGMVTQAEANGEIISFAERVLEAIRVPIVVGASQVEIDASIGVAIAPADGLDAEALLRAADVAMYRAKAAGRGTFCFYEQSMDDELRTRAELEDDVRHAVASGAIEPHYQPLMDLHTGKPVGLEILSRWCHPKRGNVFPSDFIPVIEHLGLVGEFTWSILRRACLDAKTWGGDLELSVNVSPLQLTELTFPARLLGVLNETGFPPHRLEIEITETALLTDLETVKSILASVQMLGVKVALDDFGTGYSSLYHLRELKLDKIKIDRSFIQSIKENPESQKIVNGILGMARSLSLPTTAEGIEDTEIMTRMSALGCDIGQGYLFGKAMPADEVTTWLKGHRETNKIDRRKIA